MAHQVRFIKSFISFERWGLLHFSPINGSMLPKECRKLAELTGETELIFNGLPYKNPNVCRTKQST